MPSELEELRAANERLLISGLQQHQAADEARVESAQLQALVDALEEGTLLLDVSGHVLTMNAVARAMAQPRPEATEVAALSRALPFRSVEGRALEEHEHPLARAVRGEAFVDLELILVRPDREDRRLVISARTASGARERGLAIVVFRDVTERRHLEARLAQSERLAALAALSAGMAHEINTPLAYALGNVEFVLERLPEVQAPLDASPTVASIAAAELLRRLTDALRESKEGGWKVRRIIDDLKQLGAPQASIPGPVSPLAALESSLRMTKSYVRHHATVRRDFEEVPLVRASSSQLAQVFSNLLMNAAYATSLAASDASAVKEVVVHTYCNSAGWAVVEFRDSGPGIPVSLRARIFDPFVTTKPIGEGTGLGLSVSFAIVQSLGGDLSFESVQGQGATFRVALPPAALPASHVTSPPTAAAPDSSRRRGRVLIIDDEPAVGRLIGRLLEPMHEVVAVDRAADALARLSRGESFDLVLCDVMMPVVSGQQFYERIGASHPDLLDRVVFVTGGAFTPAAQEFLDSVPNRKLMKPLELPELRAVIDEFVARSVDRAPRPS